jgi:AraC family transcriptional regulator, regulatory protein of adaptative response / methylated-DNA-[protein]-cysteine methyltransferase
MQDGGMATMTVIPEAFEARVLSRSDMGLRVDEENAWQRVIARDRSAVGAFVYAVETTGVYCRPGCASRRPARENVRFFTDWREAEAAGFRACLRCKPNKTDEIRDEIAEKVEKAAKRLREAEGERVALEVLAQAADLSRFALVRAFKKVLGVTPGEYARRLRMERFGHEVRSENGSVTEAIYSAGFGSSSRMYENAHKELGMRPSTVKSGGFGTVIRWAVAGSPLGRVLVAATERGLCSVLFADSDREAENELRKKFPRAELDRDDEGLGEEVRYVLGEMSESREAASLPFDVRATAFQQRVWEALRAIPRGETRTYGEIARKIGSPKAVRAVGAACGANPLAVVVPCHRAVGADGRLTGYRWGMERKKRLLEMERAVVGGS